MREAMIRPPWNTRGTVRDVMQKDIVTIGPDATVRELADLLIDKGITGVPVLETDGTVAGVVSTWDVVRFAAKEAAQPELVWLAAQPVGPDVEGGFFGTMTEGRATRQPVLSSIKPPLLERRTVRDIMTPAIFQVGEDTTIPDVADYLVASKIHRALVLEDGRLLGIVTSTDLLGLIARAGVGV